MPPITIGDTQIKQIIYKGQAIVTLPMIDEVYQRPNGTAGRNFYATRKSSLKNTDLLIYFMAI